MNGAIEGRGGRRGMHACMQHISIYYTGICMRGHKGAISIRAYRYSSRTKTLLNPYPTASMLHSLVTLTTRYPVRDEDMEVNPAKEKKLTNIRTVQADEKVTMMMQGCAGAWLPFRGPRASQFAACSRHAARMRLLSGLFLPPCCASASPLAQVFLSAPRLLNLEEAIGYVAGDELLEVTPAAVRIRKEVRDAWSTWGLAWGGAHMLRGTWAHGGTWVGMQRITRVHGRCVNATRKGSHFSEAPPSPTRPCRCSMRGSAKCLPRRLPIGIS